MNSADRIAHDAETVADALIALKQAGVGPIDAIRALRNARGLSLKDAKTVFSASPAWREENDAADKLHSEIIKALELEDD
jgi:ribosomal protein L7/L12